MRKMATQLSLLPGVEESLSSLAEEFREEFARTSRFLHRSLAGRKIIFNRDGKAYYPFGDWGEGSLGGAEPLAPVLEPTHIASSDSSCVLVGETSDGAVYAVRAAVSFAAGGEAESFFRIGPIIVYLTAKGSCGLPAPMSPAELRISYSDHTIAERVIRNKVEAKLVRSLLAISERMIVMSDGSLKHPSVGFSDWSPLTRSSPSTLVGFSKSSPMVMSCDATAAVMRAGGPAFSVVEGGPIVTALVKFAKDGLVFRVDIGNAKEDARRVLGRLLTNDAFAAGYPESLRIAHHLSVFTRAEDTALKAYVSKRYDLRHLPAFNLRRMTLGGLSSSG